MKNFRRKTPRSKDMVRPLEKTLRRRPTHTNRTRNTVYHNHEYIRICTVEVKKEVKTEELQAGKEE